MKLADLAQGRDNNFNLLRILAALAVLLSHSFALVHGTGDAEPMRASLGVDFGSIAVDIFFLTSGFLVTGSLLRRQSVVDFLWARFLRIYPALWVMLALTVFVLGPSLTTLPVTEYLTSSRTAAYLIRCAALLPRVEYLLPGVFESNPYKGAVNGSLWSMPLELRMYLMLISVWLVLFLVRGRRLAAFTTTIVTLAGLSGAYLFGYHYVAHEASVFAKLFFMFFTGASFFVLRTRIDLSRTIFWFGVGALVFSTVHRELFFATYHLTLAYLVFYVAFVPAGAVRRYNRVGDYSYGVYIYAFPVQQTVIALHPGVSVFGVVVTASAVTLALAACSWHFLEQNALTLKEAYVGHTRRLLGHKRTAVQSS